MHAREHYTCDTSIASSALYVAAGVEEGDFHLGGTKEIADRPRGYSKGEDTGVGCAPSRANRGSNCFKHSLNVVEYKTQKKVFSFLQLAILAIPQACIINTELEILGGH